MTEKEKTEIRQRETGIHEFRGFDECQWKDMADADEGDGKTKAEEIAATLRNLDKQIGV